MSMRKIAKRELVNMLLANNNAQPKAKYSNNILLAMLDKMPSDFVATLEPTREGFAINRGSLAECLVKYAITGECEKSQASIADLDTSKTSQAVLDKYGLPRSTNIEIKYSTSFAPATHKTSKARYTIIVSQLGIHLIESRNLVSTSAGKININNQRAKDLVELKALESRLGL